MPVKAIGYLRWASSLVLCEALYMEGDKSEPDADPRGLEPRGLYLYGPVGSPRKIGTYPDRRAAKQALRTAQEQQQAKWKEPHFFGDKEHDSVLNHSPEGYPLFFSERELLERKLAAMEQP